MPFTATVGTSVNTTWGARARRHDGRYPARGMPGESWDHDERAASPRAIDRRALMKLGLVGGALVGVPALVARATSANPRSPFEPPLGIGAASDARASANPRARVAPPGTIVSRAEWQADERIRSREIEFDATVEKIVVHHTATNSPGTNWPRQVRDVYRSTVARGYRDVPYHWLIDPDGLVYEGRWARPVAVGTRPNGEDARGRSVRGGHAKRHNDRTIGVALLGSFDDRAPTDAALDALVAVVAWKCGRWRIEPNGATPYRLKDGTEQVFPNICPHRGIRATACPGGAVTALLPELRLAVAHRLA